uniref:Uncharacterized protein n=1 Tax=uncultured prokaryote TaxID=198431 RepID=A0A0H5QQ28_9ZZZZ|nr:hypothetical protein [uncultured prokaryote]
MALYPISLHWKTLSNSAVNVFDVVNDTGAFTITVLEAIRDAANARIKPRLSDVWQLEKVVAHGAQPTELAGGSTGGDSGSCSPPGVAYLIHKSPVAGRRGRMYLPGVPENAVDQYGNISPAVITANNAALNGFLDDLAVDEMYMHMRGSEASNDRVVTLRCDGVAGTQRRRMRR